jgi:hypothetical protein
LALFGSVTYLPLFLQVVNGASPTGSGLQILPLMGGLLLTSIGSGQLISRTGRYKPFPIVGTATMVVGLSADLGVATSGATLFRSIGGSVGTAVLGSIFTSRLKSELAASPPPSAAHRLAGGVASANPAALRKLPAPLHATYVHAFTNALSTVFEVAAGVAAVAFLLSWVLRTGDAPSRRWRGAPGWTCRRPPAGCSCASMRIRGPTSTRWPRATTCRPTPRGKR